MVSGGLVSSSIDLGSGNPLGNVIMSIPGANNDGSFSITSFKTEGNSCKEKSAIFLFLKIDSFCYHQHFSFKEATDWLIEESSNLFILWKRRGIFKKYLHIYRTMSSTEQQVNTQEREGERRGRGGGRGRRGFRGRRGGYYGGYRNGGRYFRSGPRICSNCHLPGHSVRDCPKGKICRKCFQEGYY